MIIHKLIAHHLQHKDDGAFYTLQANDTLRWLTARTSIELGSATKVLDLGCGHGVLGQQFLKAGCDVTFSDQENLLFDELRHCRFVEFNIEKDPVSSLGQYDIVLFSNVLEHISRPRQFLESVPTLLNPNGLFYLSWTNWLSPWGGHDWSPFHYLGPKLGLSVWKSLLKRDTDHIPYKTLFPTYIGATKSWVRQIRSLKLVASAPRYYTELAFLTSIPVIREFLTWNCVFLMQRQPAKIE